MSIKYRLVERGQPGVAGGGIKKWYADVANNGGELGVDDLVKRIEKFSALSEADIKGVIIALENVVHEALADGKIVRYILSLVAVEQVRRKIFNISLIKSVGVNYRAGKRILEGMKSAGFEKVQR